MEEILKEILNKITNLERKTDNGFATIDKRITNLERKTDNGFTTIDNGFATINERIEMLDRGNKEEFRQINKKIDSITNVVAKTMEDITELKDKVGKQDVEIRVIKGGAANA